MRGDVYEKSKKEERYDVLPLTLGRNHSGADQIDLVADQNSRSTTKKILVVKSCEIFLGPLKGRFVDHRVHHDESIRQRHSLQFALHRNQICQNRE